MNTKLLEYLQYLFECQRCGQCCMIGGDMELGDGDISFIFQQYGDISYNLVEVPEHESKVYSGAHKFKTTHPCLYLDHNSKECLINHCKPQGCRNYPFLLYSQGGCTFEAVLYCRGAQKAIKELFG